MVKAPDYPEFPSFVPSHHSLHDSLANLIFYVTKVAKHFPLSQNALTLKCSKIQGTFFLTMYEVVQTNISRNVY